MSALAIYWSGFLIDLCIGDPHFLPHPVRAIGWWIQTCEKFLRKWTRSPRAERLGGVLLLIAVVGATYGMTWGLIWVASHYLGLWGAVSLQILMVYQLFATRCLADEGMKVCRFLQKDDLQGAKKAVSYLVSRDVEPMERRDVVKATIETVSENIIDGITSPMFFLFIGGVPLAYAFKAVNTLDSMVGYKNEKYLHFGWASARTDDWVNYIPARLTGFILSLTTGLLGYPWKRAFKVMWRDRKQHSSPNSPWSEAPTAGALGIQLGGKTQYFGVLYHKPTMGDDLELPEVNHIKGAVRVMYATALVCMILLTLVKVI